MTRRAGWSNLSAGQRDRYTRTLGQGNAKQAERLYTRGASLKRARGHDTGAAKPAQSRPKPAPSAAKRKQELQKRVGLERATLKVAANVNPRRKGKANVDKIREGLSHYTDEQLAQIQRMTAAQQRAWFRGEDDGPADASELWY